MSEKVLGFYKKDAEEVEQLLESFSCSMLCYSCWRKFLDVENRPELAKRFYKWFNGEYSNNEQAIQRIIKRIENEVYLKDLVPVRLASESVDLKTLKEWLKEARDKMPDEHDKAIVSQVTGFILGKEWAEKEAKKK